MAAKVVIEAGISSHGKFDNDRYTVELKIFGDNVEMDVRRSSPRSVSDLLVLRLDHQDLRELQRMINETIAAESAYVMTPRVDTEM